MNDQVETTADTMALWRRVEKTDPAATKKIPQGSGALSGMTGISFIAVVQMATEIFGPVGKGWGYDVLNEEYIDGGPIFAQVLSGETAPTEPLGFEKHHVCRVKVWAMLDGERIEAEHVGSTPFIYGSKYGPKTDGEAAKKSTSDGIKKALSMFGFNADIHRGDFDDAEYLIERTADAAIEKAEDKEAEKARQLVEYGEWKIGNTPKLRSAVQLSELEGLYTAAVRKAQRQSDVEYIKALNGAWKARANELIAECDDVDKLAALYKAARARAKEWTDEAWGKDLNETVTARKAEITGAAPEDVAA